MTTAPTPYEADLDAVLRDPWALPGQLPQQSSLIEPDHPWPRVAGPLHMAAPMRRPPDALLLGSLVLALSFALGVVCGIAGSFWWLLL